MDNAKTFAERLVEKVERQKEKGEKVHPFFERIYNEIQKIKAKEE